VVDFFIEKSSIHLFTYAVHTSRHDSGQRRLHAGRRGVGAVELAGLEHEMHHAPVKAIDEQDTPGRPVYPSTRPVSKVALVSRQPRLDVPQEGQRDETSRVGQQARDQRMDRT